MSPPRRNPARYLSPAGRAWLFGALFVAAAAIAAIVVSQV